MKFKFTLVALLCTYAVASAQIPKTSAAKKPGIELAKKESRALKKYDLRDLNRPRMVTSPFGNTNTGGNTTSSARAATQVEPFAQIDITRWGIIDKAENTGEILFSSERTGNSYTVKTYSDDIEVVDNFTIQVPASANQVDVMNHYSTGFFNTDADREFLIFLHYFEGVNPGPDDQVWEVWVVNSKGEILQKVDGYAAETKTDAEGKKKLFTYFADESSVTINAIAVATWNIQNTYLLNADLIKFFMGSPFNFVKIDGQEYMALAHYKHLFMDNATLEVFPDNKLMVKLLDFNLQEVKTMALDIETRYPEAGPYVIPMAEFGMFYRDQSYNISRNIFNTDSKLEIAYGVYYYDMIADNEWSTYRVANEDGVMIHELNEYIVDNFQEMNSIPGHDNQLAFLMGEEAMATKIAFFNIESWTFDLILDAVHNNDQLSASFNRIPRGNDFNYLIGIDSPDEENGNIYGVINEYSRTGATVNRKRFLLPQDVVLFQPILTRYALLPNLYANDNQLYYTYVYKQKTGNSPVYNNLVVAKDTQEKLVEFRGDTARGNIIGSTFLTDGNGTFNKMTVQYEKGSNPIHTEFYRLPFENILSVDTPSVSTFGVYPNPAAEVLNFKTDARATAVKIYGLAGNLVLNQTLAPDQKTINVSRLAPGMYLGVVTLHDGSSKQIKFIKK